MTGAVIDRDKRSGKTRSFGVYILPKAFPTAT